MTRALAGALSLISAAGWGQTGEESLCERGDRAACHRLGLAEKADAGTSPRAWFWLGRACDLGEPKACDDAAVDATNRGKWSQAAEFEEQARRWRASPAPVPPHPPPPDAPRARATVPDVPPPELSPPDLPPEPEPEPPQVPDAGVHRPLLPEIPGDGVMRAIVTRAPEPPPPRPLNQKCLDDDEYARNALVQSTKNDPTAFRPSALWMPPLFMTDAERSYTWAGLLYFESKDFAEGTRTRVVPPFFVSHCARESQTLLTPFYSYRTDSDGTASLIFTYFRRRDRLVETDILFPFVWSLRERTAEEAPFVGSGAFLPFAFWKRDPAGEHFTLVPPLFWRWGDNDETTTLAANVYWHTKASEDRFDLGIVPLYFAGRSKTAAYDVSPLLFWSFRDEQKQSLFLPLLLTWYQSRATGYTFSAGPLLFVGREGARHHTILAPVFWRWGDDTETTTVVANVFLHETPTRRDLGVAPLYFQGRSETQGDYDVVPPLFWSFRQQHKQSLFLTPLLTFYEEDPGGWSLTQFPLLFAGKQAKKWHAFLPPLVWLWGDEETTNAIAANVFVHKAPGRSDFGVVPLYFGGRSDSGDSYDVSPLLFWDFRDARKHSLFVPAALTYFASRADGFTLNQFPLLWAGREGKDHHVVVPPFFWHWGDGDEETTLAALVFWHRSQTRTDWGLAPLFFHGGDAAGAASYDVSPLLFWSFREGPKHTLVIPPLLAVHHDDGETQTTYALQTYYQSRKDGYTFNSFPLAWFGRDGQDHHEVLAPLYWNWGDDTETTTIVGSAYFHHDPHQNTTHFGLAPLYFGGRSTAGSYDVSPLVVWSFRDGLSHRVVIPPLLTFHEGDGQTETTVVAQTYFQQRPDGFSLASVPFVFAGREGASHHTFVPPLFWRWGDDEATTTIAGPAFWRTSDERTDWGVVPLYFHGPGYDVSPPLFWSFRDADSSTLVIPPLLTFHTEDANTSTTFAVNTYVQVRPYGFTFNSFPFVFLRRDGDSHHEVVPPVFFRWGEKDETTTIAGPVFLHESPTRSDFALAPLYFRGRGPDGDYDATPLFLSYRDAHRAELFIPPLLTFYEKDELTQTETAWVGQTYFQSRPYGYTLNSFPFLFAGQNGDDFHTVLPPLFWDWGDALTRTTIAGPAFWKHTPTRDTFGVAPFYFGGRGEDDDYDIAAPFFWSSRSEYKFSLLVPPLLSRVEVYGDTVSVWSLNTWVQSRPNGFTFNFMPFLFMGEEGAAHHTFVPPLYWRWGDLGETTTIAANVFVHEGPARTDWGVVPLYFHGDTVDGAYNVSPALFWSFRDGPKHSLFLPPALTWWESRPTGFTFAQFPFLFVGREGASAHTVVPPLFWSFHDGDEGKDTLFLPPLLTYWQRRPTGYTFAQFPFLFMGREGDFAHTVVPPLFWSFRDGEKGTDTLFLPPLLTYWQRRPTGYTFAQFPLLFLGRERDAFHTIVPPLFWRWGDKDEATTVVGPVFHHREGEGEAEATTFGLAPLYFGHRAQKAGWDFVTPLFYRSFDEDGQHLLMLPLFDYRSNKDSKLFVSPLAVHSSDAEHTRTIVAGLFWNMEGPDVAARVVAPLWWDFKSKKTGTRVSTVFPLYWRFEKPEEVTHLFVNIMWSTGMTPLGKSWSFHLFPLFDLVSYHPKHFLWQVLGGLVGHESQADSERWRTAWIWLDPTKRPDAASSSH